MEEAMFILPETASGGPSCTRAVRCLFILALAGVALAAPHASAQGCGYKATNGAPYVYALGPFNPQTGAASGPPLKVVALGDSIVWADGDKPEHKFVSLIGQQLANQKGRTVEVHSYAHSGAKLGAPTGEELSTPSSYPHPRGIPLGDVDASQPTTNEQADCAAVKDSDAEIVLLNGCINEVGATNIALPHIFPDQETPDQVRAAVLSSCAANMKGLLESITGQFHRAQVVVINYYRVISFDSTLDPLLSDEAKSKAQLAEKKRIDWIEQMAKRKMGSTATKEQTDKQRQAWATNSEVFLLDSTSCFKWAIAAFNTGVFTPLPAAPPAYDSKHPVGVCPPPLKPSPANSLVSLAVLPDNADYSYGAADSHLWLLPSLFAPDERYWTRKLECLMHLCRLDRDCFLNAAAHPNPEGARCYSKVILAAIDGVEPAWDSECHPTPRPATKP